jgi:hypothetical protein
MLPSLRSVGPNPPPICRRHRLQTAISTSSRAKTTIMAINIPFMRRDAASVVPAGVVPCGAAGSQPADVLFIGGAKSPPLHRGRGWRLDIPRIYCRRA